MSDTWTYRDSARRPFTGVARDAIDLRDHAPGRLDRRHTDLPDLDGYDLHATDGPVGHVEEHLDRDGEGYVIVDTAGRMWGNKRVLPAGVITAIDPERRRVDVSMSREDLNNAPCYDPGRRHAEDTWYRSLTDEYYEAFLD